MKTVGVLATTAAAMGVAYWAFSHFGGLTGLSLDFVAGTVVVTAGFTALIVSLVIAETY